MKHLSGLAAFSVAIGISAAGAQTLTTKQAVEDYFDGAVFIEFSNSRQENIQSLFDKGRWLQAKLDGEILGSAQMQIKDDGAVCPEWWQGNCAYIHLVDGGFQFAPEPGDPRGKLFRRHR